MFALSSFRLISPPPGQITEGYKHIKKEWFTVHVACLRERETKRAKFLQHMRGFEAVFCFNFSSKRCFYHLSEVVIVHLESYKTICSKY